MLKAVVVASAGAGAAAARQAAEECIASGSDVIVGPGGAEHAALVTLVAGASGRSLGTVLPRIACRLPLPLICPSASPQTLPDSFRIIA